MHTVEMYDLWGDYELLQQKARQQCANMPLLDLPCMYSVNKHVPYSRVKKRMR